MGLGDDRVSHMRPVHTGLPEPTRVIHAPHCSVLNVVVATANLIRMGIRLIDNPDESRHEFNIPDGKH